MKKNGVTMDDLAGMVKRGFDDASKDTTKGFSEVNMRLDKVEVRLDRIENLLIRAHDNRITVLEDGMRLIKTKLGIK